MKPNSNLRWPQHPEGSHVRTCQECGNTIVTKPPSEYKDDSWRDINCRKCKSEGCFDYGCLNLPEMEDDE